MRERKQPGSGEANNWQLQDAKARLSELVNRAVKIGPQIVTRRGQAVVVLVSIAEWEALQGRAGETLKDWLLVPEARTDELVPARQSLRWRDPPEFG